MGRRGLPLIVAVAAATLLAADAATALGEVIRSWPMTGTAVPYALGIVRDDTYVYGVLYSAANSGYLRTYTPTGSEIGSVPLTVSGTVRDGDNCDLGANYCTVISMVSGASGMVYKVVKSTGSIAFSFPVTGPGTNTINIAYIQTSGYYAIGSAYNGTRINLYTTAGSTAGSWNISTGQTYMGALAWSPMVNWMSGSYVIYSAWSSGVGHTVFAYPSGSVVGSANWGAISTGNANGSCCGAGSPATLMTQFWANMYNGSGLYCYEYQLNWYSSVIPTSLGMVKALYR